MAYCCTNFRTKKALKEAVKQGDGDLGVFQPGPFDVSDGQVSLEGPHYPEAHRWYAQVWVEDGRIKRVIS